MITYSYQRNVLTEGGLIWNSNSSPKSDFLHAYTHAYISTPHLKREIYM